MNRDAFDLWYSTHAVAARFVTGLDRTVSERTIRQEIERQPALKAAAVRKFGQVFLPWAVLSPWLQISAPPKQMPKPGGLVLLEPIKARSPGELTRKLGKLVQAPGQEATHG